ncbi:glycosyltransferase family protein [Anaeromicropila herbilytica]|uniref:Glycosyl transferase n=1 Tax=Anaeromicropila herbilytica TaxID=2785025 RepID=A0A7R7ENT8_9FIRM|nr:hypothetical protein [Anaeromicropila herbilytica]BCN32218.1 glycosyl transferase [Anaeromicropila herbilytica]
MKILYLAPIAFDGLKQRPQHIAEELSKNNEVWYIDPTISFMKYLIKGGEKCFSRKYDVSNNLHIIRLNGVLSPHISVQGIDHYNFTLFPEFSQIKGYVKKVDIIWVAYSGWYGLIKWVRNKIIIYDKMDDDINLTKNKLLRKYLLRIEPKLIRKADYIFVTAIKFYNEISAITDNVSLVPNAVSIEKKYIEYNGHDIKKRVFGYIGTIGHWFDIEAIRTIAEADENCEVILVGPNMLPELHISNVKYVNTISKEKIFDMISTFDVCLYTFKQDILLDTINPVKIYEYLAMNKPVLAVKSLEIDSFGTLLETYENYSELSSKCKKTFKKPFKTEKDYINFINANSWEIRVKHMLEKIEVDLY